MVGNNVDWVMVMMEWDDGDDGVVREKQGDGDDKMVQEERGDDGGGDDV